jgi:hypothetical protein
METGTADFVKVEGNHAASCTTGFAIGAADYSRVVGNTIDTVTTHATFHSTGTHVVDKYNNFSVSVDSGAVTMLPITSIGIGTIASTTAGDITWTPDPWTDDAVQVYKWSASVSSPNSYTLTVANTATTNLRIGQAMHLCIYVSLDGNGAMATTWGNKYWLFNGDTPINGNWSLSQSGSSGSQVFHGTFVWDGAYWLCVNPHEQTI